MPIGYWYQQLKLIIIIDRRDTNLPTYHLYHILQFPISVFFFFTSELIWPVFLCLCIFSLYFMDSTSGVYSSGSRDYPPKGDRAVVCVECSSISSSRRASPKKDLHRYCALSRHNNSNLYRWAFLVAVCIAIFHSDACGYHHHIIISIWRNFFIDHNDMYNGSSWYQRVDVLV